MSDKVTDPSGPSCADPDPTAASGGSDAGASAHSGTSDTAGTRGDDRVGEHGSGLATDDSDAAEPPVMDSADPGSDEETPAPRVSGPRLGRTGLIAVTCVVAILFVAAVTSSVYFYLQNRHNEATLAAQAQARDTACKYGPVLATYDSKHLDAYFEAVLAGATGDWRKQFDSTSKDLRDVLIKGEVATSVSDTQCAIVSGDTTSAQAVVVVGQSITSLGTQGKPEPGQLAISMRLEKDGNRWLVNKVDSPLATTPGS